jgi:Protein of unknown function (DUF2809)
MLTFHLKFFLFTLLLFIVEVLIALFVHDRFVRPYLGDYIVVFLIYCAVRTVLKAPVLYIVTGVLLFAYTIEMLQYFNIVDRLGLADNRLAKTVIGYGFEWLDMLAYTLGAGTIMILETVYAKKTGTASVYKK